MRYACWFVFLSLAMICLGKPLAKAADYLLAPGDELSISVFGHDDLTGDYRIDDLGRIAFPLLGAVQASGRTVDTLAGELTEALNRDYLVNPQVSVEVLTFKPVFVMGQVNGPGSYPYSPGLLVREAIALAGGYTRRGDPNDISILRQESGSTAEIDATEETVLLPGDTVEVHRRLF